MMLQIGLWWTAGMSPEAIARPTVETSLRPRTDTVLAVKEAAPGMLDSAAPLTGRIAFYNVENLFYPTRDTNIADEDYTQTSSRHWS